MNMNYKLFIDDERFPVTPDWFVARNSFQAIKALDLYGLPSEIAFDHDLGGRDTAITFLKYLENYLLDNGLHFPRGFAFSIHSQNPIGAENIRCFMNSLIEAVGIDE